MNDSERESHFVAWLTEHQLALRLYVQVAAAGRIGGEGCGAAGECDAMAEAQ